MTYQKPKPFDQVKLSDFTHHYRCGDVIEPISYWVGRKAEVGMITSVCEEIEPDSEKRAMLVLGTAIGFEPYLFAKTGCYAQVVGINLSEAVQGPAYTHPNLRMECCDAQTAARAYRDHQITCLLCPYMESGANLTPEILAIDPKLIVYVYDQHGLCGPLTKQAWERDQIRAFEPGCSYRRICKWRSVAHYCLSAMIEGSFCAYEHPNQNVVELQLRQDLMLPEIGEFQGSKYPWEDGLEPVEVIWLSTSV